MENENQLEFLRDTKENGEERPWKDKKIKNTYLKDSYERIGYEQKAFRACWCSSWLEFKVCEGGVMKLHNAKFCQLRLCSTCNWRKELKIFAQLSKVVNEIENKYGYRYIFLTLTCENVYGSELISTIDDLFSAFKRLFELKDVRRMAKGFFRALEITHDTNRKITRAMYKKKKKYYDDRFLKVGDINPNFDKYHPHFHVMIAVNKSYFKDVNAYITQSEWTSMWKQSLRVDYIPIVDVRAVKNFNKGEIKEVAKYTVKDTDFIVEQDKQLTDSTVKVLDEALSYRRLVAYGGEMRKMHKDLNLDDDVAADIYISEDGEILDLPYEIRTYKWHVGYKNYVLRKGE